MECPFCGALNGAQFLRVDNNKRRYYDCLACKREFYTDDDNWSYHLTEKTKKREAEIDEERARVEAKYDEVEEMFRMSSRPSWSRQLPDFEILEKILDKKYAAMQSPNEKSWLDIAAEITSGDRRRDYGAPLVNFLRIAILWSAYMEEYISPINVAYMMVLMKVAREMNTSKEDNPIDILGYVACIQTMDQDLKQHGYEQGNTIFSEYTSAAQLQTLLNDLFKKGMK